MIYQLWYSSADTLDDLVDAKELEYICFSFLRKDDFKEKGHRFLKVRFNNRMSVKETEDWFSLFSFKNKLVSYDIGADYYSFTIDLFSMSYRWILTLLTLYRYPGEYTKIVSYTNMLMVDLWISPWKALLLAHQIYIEDEDRYTYNVGHALMWPGGADTKLDILRIEEELTTDPLYYNSIDYLNIQTIWSCYRMGDRVRYDEEFKEKHNAK